MKQFFQYYLIHWVQGLLVLLLLCIVGFFANMLLSFLPVFRLQAVVAVQVLLFCPTAYGLGKVTAKATVDHPSSGLGYYASFLLVQLPLLFFLISCTSGYFQVLELQELLLQSMSGEELSQTLLTTDGEKDLFQLLLSMLIKVPEFSIQILDNLVLNVLGYGVLVLGMMIAMECSRLFHRKKRLKKLEMPQNTST